MYHSTKSLRVKELEELEVQRALAELEKYKKLFSNQQVKESK